MRLGIAFAADPSVRTFLVSAFIVAVCASPSAAQPTTDDGIRALLAGDDQAAAAILRPLAHDNARPDPVAQFFLGILYDSGHGVVAPDNQRAWCLFLQASVPTNPFVQQAMAIAESIRDEIGQPTASARCAAAERRQVTLLTRTVAVSSMHEDGAGTVDGVAALARGDYMRAVRILKPVAQDWRGTDPAAEFFMAGLYEAGRGVMADPLRACALYDRASGDLSSPFGTEAVHLFRASILRGGQEFFEECQALANVGLDNGFEPVTFNLSPQYTVAWTLSAATVTYRSSVTRTETVFWSPGARILPLRETDLLTGRKRSTSRHFVEAFYWEPSSAAGRSWRLRWTVYEIVRDAVIPVSVSSDPLAIAEGGAPPSADAFDVREYARLGVDDNGEAEATVLKGPHSTTTVIESDQERQEARDRDAARAAAFKTIDWTRQYPVTRPPALAYVDNDGCGDVVAYGWSSDRARSWCGGRRGQLELGVYSVVSVRIGSMAAIRRAGK